MDQDGFNGISDDLKVPDLRKISIQHLTKTHNWVEWTAPSVSLSQTKINDINLNDRPQMQNDIENEIGRSLFPFIHGLRILISFVYLHQSHGVKISLGCLWVDT